MPPEPPARKPPIVAICRVEGYISSSCPVSRAASSSREIRAPASTRTAPSRISITLSSRVRSMTTPPSSGTHWP